MSAASRRRIAVVTGIRSEYDILYSTLRSIEAAPSLELQLVVTGTHLSDVYGLTVREIMSDGFAIAESVESLLGADSPTGRAKSAGLQLLGLAHAFGRLQPDLVLAPCDREEAITTALAATYLGIPVAHLYGGDKSDSGIVDEVIRHATTKLAHLHLVMAEPHRERVIRMGEEPWRVHVVGHGGIDRLLETPELTRSDLLARLELDPGERSLAVVIQHPMSNDIENAPAQMRLTLELVDEAGLAGVVIFPNSDVGSQPIIQVIREFTSARSHWRHSANLPRLEFVNLLRQAKLLVGNSSLGILEAPALGLPVINVGPRQVGRLHGENVLFVPHERTAILRAIETTLTDPQFRARVAARQSPFGAGDTGPRVASLLAETPLGAELLRKENTF